MTTTLAKSGLSASGKPGSLSRRLKMMLMAPPKVGKTVIAHSMPRTRTIDFDDGMQSIEWAVKAGIIHRDLNDIVYETVKPPVNPKKGKNPLELAEVQILQWIKEEDIPSEEWSEYCSGLGFEIPYTQEWDTLILDSETFLKDAAINLGMKEAGRMGLSKSWANYGGGTLDTNMMTYPDWGSASKLIWKFNEWCANLGKNLVVTVHEYMETDDAGALIAVVPNTIGQLRQQLPALFDEFWGVSVSGTRDKPKYRIQTSPDIKKALGSRLGCLDPIEDADFDAIKKKVCKFYGIEEQWLWTAYHGQAGVDKAIEEAQEAEGASL